MSDRHLNPSDEAPRALGDQPRARLQVLLGLFEGLEEAAQELLEATAPRTRERILGRRRRLRDEILGILDEGPPRALEPLLGKSAAALDAPSLALLVRLLHQRLASDEPYLSGRDLLRVLADSSWELLDRLPLLAPDAPLLASGLVFSFVPEGQEEAEILDRGFGLARDAYRRLLRPASLRRPSRSEPRPFADGIDHFLTTAALLRLLERRAARVFPESAWGELHGEPEAGLEELDRRIERLRRRIRERLARSRDLERFPLVRLGRDLQLGEAELLMVAALAAQEALFGQPALDAIDLLRLVSRSLRDLLRRRALLAPTAPLLEHDVIRFEEGGERDSLTGAVRLAPWALDRLVGGPVANGSRIGSDEKIDFHDFLSRLDGSDDFYDQL